jgi:hypothetical protein
VSEPHLRPTKNCIPPPYTREPVEVFALRHAAPGIVTWPCEERIIHSANTASCNGLPPSVVKSELIFADPLTLMSYPMSTV